jgi:putative spermidine/putrescine transport system permease protein
MTSRGLVLPALAAYIVLLLWPLAGVFWTSITPDGFVGLSAYTRFLSDGWFLSVLRRTVVLSLITTALTLVLSFPIALYLSQTWRRGRTLVTFAIIAPMLVSAVARSYGWIIILGPAGILSRCLAALGLGSGHLLYTETGIVIASVHLLLPLMVLPIAGSLQQIDPSLIRAAQTLGAGVTRILFRVTLPMCIPGMTAGAVIVFCMCASSFVTPALIGGPTIPMMSFVIYQQAIQLIDWPFASAAAFILLAATASVTLAYLFWAGTRRAGARP